MKIKAGYIGIKEASLLVGVHPDTIRRLIKQHKGSSNIVQGKGSKAPYYLNADWLKAIYSLNEPHTAPTAGDHQQVDKEPSPDTNNAISVVVEALTAQLEAKDKQIDKLQHIIAEKEANTTKLQDQFQQLLATTRLPAQAASTTAYEADITEAPPQQVNSKPRKPQSRRKTTTKQVKRQQVNSKPKSSPKKVTTKKQSDNIKATKQVKKRWWNRG